MEKRVERPLTVRKYGHSGPLVIVLHGGPAAAGSARKLAENLADTFRVLEPWQRGSEENRPLTVKRHIADLDHLIQTVASEKQPALVGESWGAMLALAYGAKHPQKTGPIVLVGCGTFDPLSRSRVAQTRSNRIAAHIAEHPQFAQDLLLPPAVQVMKWHTMTDNYAPISLQDQSIDDNFDIRAHQETWEDMLRCQRTGIYPQAFEAITVPVLMLHGTYDPHPGRMIRDSLKAVIGQLEYHEFEKCGHHPANERWAREAFLTTLKKWLLDRLNRKTTD